MQNIATTRLLFPTSFSDACFRTIPALSEWMDDPNAHLTLLHVYNPKKVQRQDAEKKLHSFFAEADQYGRCERLLLAGKPAETILQHCKQIPYDLLFVPGSVPSGFPRIGHQSIRVSLLRNGQTPVWTSEDLRHSGSLRQKPKNVAYIMSNDRNWQQQFVTAAQAAARWNATFHLIYVFPVPDVGDGTLASDLFVEQQDGPLEELRRLGRNLPMPVRVHTSSGDSHIELPRLLDHCGADLVFMDSEQAVVRGIFGQSIHPMLRSIPGQFVCFPKDSGEPNESERLQVLDQLQLLRIS